MTENQDRILLDDPLLVQMWENIYFLITSDTNTDVGFFINTEIGTTIDFPDTQENIILNKIPTIYSYCQKDRFFIPLEHLQYPLVLPNSMFQYVEVVVMDKIKVQINLVVVVLWFIYSSFC